jgi:hypothetical protein
MGWLASLPASLASPSLPDTDLDAEWPEILPHALGAFYDLAAAVLTRLPDIELKNLPRMADYARVLAAVDAELGTRRSRYQITTERSLEWDSSTGRNASSPSASARVYAGPLSRPPVLLRV